MSAGTGTDLSASTRDDLVGRLLEHCAQVCTTGDEGPIADTVVARYTELGEEVLRVGHSVVVDGRRGEPARPLVLLVGHLDVVPPTDADLEPRVESRDGAEVVVARGASDMKAGNVLAMAAFEDHDLREASPYDLALVLYAGEEGAADANELREVLAEVPWLRGAALAIVLEPTDGEVQLGCLGGLHAVLTFEGQQAHSARPWHGRNALTMAGEFLAELDRDHVRDVEVDGIAYRDVWSATQAWTPGLEPGPRPASSPVRNVVPGTFMVNVNFRFAPSRGVEQAEAELRERVDGRASVEVVDRSPEAPPRLSDPIVQAFVRRVDAPVAAKQAWTDVARFAEVGVPALNYGPGLTGQAHQRGEYVPVDALVAADVRLRAFLQAPA
ncbi:succinyl-diaminopimelate desuccinylase [Egicoccus halophilus]|uniref:Succinyl-diaminopimelate desuccinylase n=1 Tax=Egicoccus halophilus TaxID=1670830 RepID=A0A8J3ADV6_9ACTN|nr:succinyl-diaminopimelate desuccinylase [Egicoccus halophilus]GGI06396.1 succinyl-diaminopimelate desuccinylase [Egicoccus halophilus]